MQLATMHVLSEGGATISIALEGTIDMVNWFTVSGPNPFTERMSTGAGGPVCVAYRGNILSMTGGTDPKVTAHIAIKE
jgi:hypothetical protein